MPLVAYREKIFESMASLRLVKQVVFCLLAEQCLQPPMLPSTNSNAHVACPKDCNIRGQLRNRGDITRMADEAS
ncbi:hypothetical protein XELAEV_18028754mg [Xenopus laevis]|uniref:Uncharacterized protein n=1 Tax=Xenopus laevis TaxID=8355 RepID=A0A974CQU0_XENLA|nr:hypothetical protein XELAEV_18028754mg [Xenopus laevis]